MSAKLVQELYLAYYGRPADPTGLDFWVKELAAASGKTDAIIAAFGTSAEAKKLYDGKTAEQAINALYQQIFGRDADPVGLKFYSEGLTKGTYTLPGLANSIKAGAINDDGTILTNRTAVADSFTAQVKASGAAYTGSDAETLGRSFVASVTKDTATRDAQISKVSSAIEDLALGAGTVKALVSAAETVAGTEGRDVFTGVVSGLSASRTLSDADSITGGAGSDSIRLDMQGNFGGFDTTKGGLSGVETIELTNSGAIARSFDATGVAGATTYVVNAKVGGVSLANLPAAGATVALNDMASGTFSAQVKSTVVSTPTTDAMAFTLRDVGATSAVVIDTDNIETITLTSAGASNKVSLAGAEAATAVTIGGASDITVSAFGAAVKAIDAGKATGKVGVTTTAATALASVTGGSSDDLVTTAATTGVLENVNLGAGKDELSVDSASLRANATIAGGDGVDTLTYASGAAATVQYAMTGVETVKVGALTGALVFDGTKADVISTITLNGMANAMTFSTMAAGNLTVAGEKGQTTANTLTTDQKGILTLTTKAGTAAATTSLATNVTAAGATEVKIATGAYATYTGTVTAAAATNVTISDAASLSSDKTSSTTGFGGTVTAAKAEQFTVTAASQLAGTITAAAATSGRVDLTDAATGASNSTLAINAAKLEQLTITSSQTLNLSTGSTLSGLQVASVSTSKGTITLPALAKISSLTLTGTGKDADDSAFSVGALGGSNGYPVTVTLIGTNAANTIASIASDNGLTFDVSKATEAVTVTNAITGSTGKVTINASGATKNVTLSGGVDAAEVVLNALNHTGTGSWGTITTDKFDFDGQAVKANTIVVTPKGTTLAATVDGGISNDSVTLTGKADTTSITLSGALNIQDATGSDTVSVTTGNTTATATVTVNVSAVTGVEKTTVTGTAGAKVNVTGNATGANSITGGAGVDTITGGAAADTITGGAGADSLTGGAGADIFVYTALSETGNVTAFTSLTTGNTTSIQDGEKYSLAAGVDVVAFAKDDELVFKASPAGFTAPTSFIQNAAALDDGVAITGAAHAIIRGTWTAGTTFGTSTSEFTVSSTGADSLYLFRDGANAGVTGLKAIVLKGYVSTTGASAGSEVIDAESYTGLIGTGG